jgi:hypothetical protein
MVFKLPLYDGVNKTTNFYLFFIAISDNSQTTAG